MEADKESRLHGSIFFLLKKFVLHNFSQELWILLNKESGIEEHEYELTKNYPLRYMELILLNASKHSGLSIPELKERFGKYMVPDLFVLYHNYLNPTWQTFDVLENTETIMHSAVRKLNNSANPPVLHVSRVNANLLIIDYFSKRRMGSLAVGIIKGIAKFYKEEDNITVTPVTKEDDERMQIRVEYKK